MIESVIEKLEAAARAGRLGESTIRKIVEESYYPVTRRLMNAIRAGNSNDGKVIRGRANDNIADIMERAGISREGMQPEVEAAHAQVLLTLGIDYGRDHNSRDTPRRLAKMELFETFNGRYEPEPVITQFPRIDDGNQLVAVNSLVVESQCSHHHQNIRGLCHIAVLYNEGSEAKVMGLSKLSRILRWYTRRPQIQEEMVNQIAAYIMEKVQPLGVAVRIEAEHQCMSVRGVHEPHALTSTTKLLGDFLEYPEMKNEWLQSLPVRTHAAH